MSKPKKKPLEAAQGRYFALPHNVLDSDAWKRTSPPARALLLELCRQHTGANNGALHLARAWVEKRGWSRPATVRKLSDELLQNRLLIQTRHGGLNNGAHQYALTWLPITNFVGIDLTSREYAPGQYLLPPLPARPACEKKQNSRTPHVLEKQLLRTPHVLEGEAPRTPHVLKTGVLGTSPRTPHVHNEYNQYIPGFDGLIRRGWAFVGWRKPRQNSGRAIGVGLKTRLGGKHQ
jgi:hypothetical protein